MKLKKALTLVLGVALLATPIAPAMAAPVGESTQVTTFDPVITGGANCGAGTASYNPESGMTLLAWNETLVDDSAGVVKGQLLDGTGAVSGEIFTISAESDFPTPAGFDWCEPVELASYENGWLAIWPGGNNEEDGWDDDGIYGRLISAEGEFLGDEFQVSETLLYWDIETVTASWSPDDEKFLVTWKARADLAFPDTINLNENQQIVGRFVSIDGTALGSDFLITNTDSGFNNSQAVAYGNGIWVAVGADNDNDSPYAQIVNSDGPVGSPFLVDTSDPAEWINGYPSIVYNPQAEKFLIVWSDTNKDVIGRFLDSAGEPVGENMMLAEDALSARPRVANGYDGGFLVTWHDNPKDIYGVQLDVDGVPGEVLVIEDFANAVWRPSVTYSCEASAYVVFFPGNPGDPNEQNLYFRLWETDAVEDCITPSAAPKAPKVAPSYLGPIVTSKVLKTSGSNYEFRGEQLNKLESLEVNGITVKITSHTDGKVTFELPAGLAAGKYDLVLNFDNATMTYIDAITVTQPATTTPTTQKLNAVSLPGRIVVYAKGYEGKKITWKIAGKWGTTTAEDGFISLARATAKAGKSAKVELYVDGELELATSLVTQ